MRLSYDLTPEDPVPAGIEPLRLIRHKDMQRGDPSNVMEITLLNHVGTHMDAPRHFAPEGLTLTDFPPEDFVFRRPLCLDLSLGDGELVSQEHLQAHAASLAESDLLLVRTGFSRVRSTDPDRYATLSPGFSASAARFLREQYPALRAVGLDTISLACMVHLEEGIEAHRVLLGGQDRRFLVIEDMDLSHDLQGLRRVIALPLMVAGADGAPCTVIGELK